MALNLKVFSANYKLGATNYNVNGASHDGISLRATAPFFTAAGYAEPGLWSFLCVQSICGSSTGAR